MDVPSSLDDARAAAHDLGAAAPVGVEEVPVAACVGRTTGEDLLAGSALPRFEASAMDGWAVRAEDLAGAGPDRPVTLRVVGESRAGHPATTTVGPGTALRISTGARLPPGADAVVRIEESSRETADAVLVRVAVDPGRDVRRAGEDVAAGSVVVRAGELLHAGHVALLAGLGVGVVRTRVRPRVLVLVTGDEVVAGGGPLDAGRIHDVGGPALVALLQAAGAEVVALRHVGDDAGATVAALEDPAADLVVSCGGMSVGEHDHVRAALRALGARERIGGIALQPGRPAWLGALPGSGGPRPVLALPGNPGAAITVATLLVGPLLAAMTGRPAAPPLWAGLSAGVRGDARRTRALRVALSTTAEGRRTAEVLEGQQPHRLASLPRTDGYALIPAADGELPAGTVVEVVPVLGAG